MGATNVGVTLIIEFCAIIDIPGVQKAQHPSVSQHQRRKNYPKKKKGASH
jgi:hypothetical protein